MKLKELEINWMHLVADFGLWIEGQQESLVKPLSPGVEADVFCVKADGVPAYIIKRWRRDFAPLRTPQEQFDLLDKARSLNLPISRAVGWGADASGRGILATDCDGEPLKTPTLEQIEVFASALSVIHDAPFKEFGFETPKDNRSFLKDLIGTRSQFPGLDSLSHSDIRAVLEQLIEFAPSEKFSLIHGDYNLGNLLFKGTQFSVIDWTTSRVGDFRSDLAWSSFLLWIYQNEQYRMRFIESYARSRDIALDPNEFRVFELIAGLQWILIRRQFPVGGDLNKAYDFVKARLIHFDIDGGFILEARRASISNKPTEEV